MFVLLILYAPRRPGVRLLGKALFDGQLVHAHLVRPLYKHLLGWPIAFSDLEHVDHFTHESLIKMTELDDVEV